MRTPTVVAALLVAVLGCGSDRGKDTPADAGDAATPVTGGTLVIAASGDPDILLPPLVASAVADMVTDQIFDPLASIGADLNTVGDRGFQPRLAERWTWSADSLSIAFHLDPDARWHDGAPVRARDVVFTHATYTDPKTGSPVATNLSSIDSVTARDSLTAVFWFRRRTPEQFQDAAYTMAILPQHLLGDANRAQLRSSAFGRQPVGTGRFRFVKWEPGVRLELMADTANYRGRARLDRVILSFAPDFNTAVAKLFSGEADFFEILRPEQLEEIRKHPTLRTIPYRAMDFMYLQFNLKAKNGRPHPVLGDRETRRALSMALDREKMVRNVFDSLAVVGVGPGPRGQASTDTAVTPLPYDTVRARRALDSLGWRDTNGDGVRERNGRPLQFTVLVPSSSRNRVRLAVLMQEQLRPLGVRLDIEELEFTTFIDRMGKRDFEAIMGAAHTDPSPIGLRQAWSSAAATARDGSNFGSYQSAAFDAQVDSGLASMDPVKARAHFKAAFQIIIDDAAAVWLYEPRPIAGAHSRIRTTGIRPDGWWSGLADWWIPESERLDRDRIGLRAPVSAAADTTARASDTSRTR